MTTVAYADYGIGIVIDTDCLTNGIFLISVELLGSNSIKNNVFCHIVHIRLREERAGRSLESHRSEVLRLTADNLRVKLLLDRINAAGTGVNTGNKFIAGNTHCQLI